MVGDIHGFVELLHRFADEARRRDDISAMIQVGDFGLSQSHRDRLSQAGMRFAVPTYVIDGNHEYFDFLLSNTAVTEILPNLFYCPRGTVLTLDGRVIAFMGGAASIDKVQQGDHWDARENISTSDVDRLYENLALLGNPAVDILVCHCPPRCVLSKYFDTPTRRVSVRRAYGVPMTWDDPNADVIQDIWIKLKKPNVICGHMHEYIQFGENSFVLDINQVHIL